MGKKFVPKIKVDTNPENMLSKNEFARVFHNQKKKKFTLYNYIVLGIVNKKETYGVFNVATLTKIYNITQSKRVS